MPQRIIGIRHQEKMNVEGEQRPTQFFITEPGKEPVTIEFKDLSEELAWVMGRYAAEFREVTDRTEDITEHRRFAKFTKQKADDVTEGRHPSQILVEEGKTLLVRQVPVAYDGVSPDDVYVGMMGGTGHMLAASLAAQLDRLQGPGKVMQVAPAYVVERYGIDRDRDNDAEMLITMMAADPKNFHQMFAQDIKIARVKSKWSLRKAAQKARISHELRLRKIAIMEAYADPFAFFEGADLESATLRMIAGDEDMETLEADEGKATRDLDAAVKDTEVWQKLFAHVEGVGPAIAGGLIAVIGNLRRFPTPEQLVSYCGVAVVTHDKHNNKLDRATIQRRRSGEVANYSNDARRCLWNFADQCNKRPGSVWGTHLLKIKSELRAKHPEKIQERNAKGKLVWRYTDGHILKMARWRLMTDFVWMIWIQWKRIHKYPGDLYYTNKKNNFNPRGTRNKGISLDFHVPHDIPAKPESGAEGMDESAAA